MVGLKLHVIRCICEQQYGIGAAEFLSTNRIHLSLVTALDTHALHYPILLIINVHMRTCRHISTLRAIAALVHTLTRVSIVLNAPASPYSSPPHLATTYNLIHLTTFAFVHPTTHLFISIHISPTDTSQMLHRDVWSRFILRGSNLTKGHSRRVQPRRQLPWQPERRLTYLRCWELGTKGQ